MEDLPIEVVGYIFSHADARDVVVASSTSWKWREALRYHVRGLSFDSSQWPGYLLLDIRSLESLITRTILQTTRLESLWICMGNRVTFSSAPVLNWLKNTRDTLTVLVCWFGYSTTSPRFDFLDRCGQDKLVSLSLGYAHITGIKSNHLKFSRLTHLELVGVSVSAFNLNCLLTACPRLVEFRLIQPKIAEAALRLTSPSLRKIVVGELKINNIILKVNSLEKLHFHDCDFEFIELGGESSLKSMKFDRVGGCLGIAKNIEELEILGLRDLVLERRCYDMISKYHTLRTLDLWRVKLEGGGIVMDPDRIAACFPRLCHLSLSYNDKDEALGHRLRGSSLLPNVVTLKLGWTSLTDLFMPWVEGLLQICPNIEELIIHGGMLSGADKEHEVLSRLFTSMVRLMRTYLHVKFSHKFV